MMKVNMAVYTAVHGFDWQPGTVFERRELNRFYEMIGDFPDIMMQKVPFGGAFVCDGRFVFYRFHVNVHGDSRGRDALYCVVGAVPVEDAPRLDLAQVMTAPEFAGPVKPFPVGMDGKEIAPAGIPKTRRELQSRVDAIAGLNDIGSCAAYYSRGSFVCRITETEGRFAFKVQCANPDIVDPLPPPPPPPPPPRPSVAQATKARDANAAGRVACLESKLDGVERENVKLKDDLRRLTTENNRLVVRLTSWQNAFCWTVVLVLVAALALLLVRGCADTGESCLTCQGRGVVASGQTVEVRCEACEGTGKVAGGLLELFKGVKPCSACGGSGKHLSAPREVGCPACRGSGKAFVSSKGKEKAK